MLGDCGGVQGPPLQCRGEQAKYLAALSDLHENLGLQHENRQHVTRRFVYSILSPLALCNMLLASGPFILNIPAAICFPFQLNGIIPPYAGYPTTPSCEAPARGNPRCPSPSPAAALNPSVI